MDEALKKQITEHLSVSVEVAAKVFNLGNNAAYRAVQAGQIPSIRIGGRIRVPTAPLRKMLGLEAA
jgi:excisionase family DNA binding protein